MVQVTFVDGGIVSNFPLDLFHDTSSIPLWPTFGVRLGSHLDKLKDTANSFSLFVTALDSSRQALDRGYLENNEDKAEVITTVQLSDKFFWLDFKMQHSVKLELFRAGAEAARDFLVR